MAGQRDPDRPVEAVQDAAIEHALTAGESRRALALVGALDPLRAAAGEDPALTALSTTLVSWVGLRERDPAFGASPSAPPTAPTPRTTPVAGGPDDGSGGRDTRRRRSARPSRVSDSTCHRPERPRSRGVGGPRSSGRWPTVGERPPSADPTGSGRPPRHPAL
ncbi:hypothetical protein ACFQRB_11830 [Halobaculum litoreum]|uniref:Uncharacterized protein n=1 Tax=Halobaculum litoreum TaxID=3031998 RepID=A0ABD5XP91_9EURY